MRTDTVVSRTPGKPAHRMGPKELLALVSAIMAFGAMGIDFMLSAFDEIRVDFDLGLNSTETSRVVTVYLLGLAFGQLFYGPLADRFGRKRTLYAGAAIYMIGAVGCALAPSFDLLLGGDLCGELGRAVRVWWPSRSCGTGSRGPPWRVPCPM